MDFWYSLTPRREVIGKASVTVGVDELKDPKICPYIFVIREICLVLKSVLVRALLSNRTYIMNLFLYIERVCTRMNYRV